MKVDTFVCGKRYPLMVTIDRVVSANGPQEASEIPLLGHVGSVRWIGKPDVHIATLAEIEAQALADWQAQRPTSSPLALSQARGE